MNTLINQSRTKPLSFLNIFYSSFKKFQKHQTPEEPHQQPEKQPKPNKPPNDPNKKSSMLPLNLTNLQLRWNGPKNIFEEIMQKKRYELIPLYVQKLHKRFYPKNRYFESDFMPLWKKMIGRQNSQKGFDPAPKLDVQQTKQWLREAYHQEKQSNESENQEKKEEELNKNKNLMMKAIGAGIFLFVLSNIKIDINNEKKAQGGTNLNSNVNVNGNKNSNMNEKYQKASKEMNELSIENSSILAETFGNLKEIHIKQSKRNMATVYHINFHYKNDSIKEVTYVGNPNALLSCLEQYELNSFEKTKVYFDQKEYTFGKAFTDTLGLFTPFIGIAITYWIFRKGTPDALMSKINPKKSFKIEGLKNITVKFKDVAGMEEAKKQITQFVDFLKQSQKYVEMGAKIPKGALLTGPPGTGKTMLAKACAGEAGVSFFYISGSEFVEMFVGLGASKVRQLFARARLEAPSIIFIDEIDAIGKKRETSRNQEKDSTLNQLLVEMDGFASHQTVIVLAATNRKDILDSALTRPGRFDRMVEITLPDIKSRQEILMVHLKHLKINPNQTLEQVAKRLSELTPGFSGADLANLCNQAAIIATRKSQHHIEQKDFEDASERITAGYEKKDLSTPKTKKRVAIHEAGHAVSGWFLSGGDPLVKLTIIPRSKGALGYAQYLPKSSYIKTKDQLIDQIAIMLGGISSEELFYGNISSGGSDDLQKVYRISRKMIAEFGMGKDTYNVTVDQEAYVKKQSQFLAKKIDDQMMDLINQAKSRCRQVLKEKKAIVEALADELLQKETINSADILRIMGPRPKFD